MDKMKFEIWIKEVIKYDPIQSFLLDGYQTGEIFEWHEWWMQGLTPSGAIQRNLYLYGP